MPNGLRLVPVVVLGPLDIGVVHVREAPAAMAVGRNVGGAFVGLRVQQKADRCIQAANNVFHTVIAFLAELDATIGIVILRLDSLVDVIVHIVLNMVLHNRLLGQREFGRLVANRVAVGRGRRIGREEGHIVEKSLHDVPAEFLIFTIVGINYIFFGEPEWLIMHFFSPELVNTKVTNNRFSQRTDTSIWH